MRVRLTLAVGMLTALFVTVATLLLSERALTAVFDGVRADLSVVPEELVATPAAEEALVVYRWLEADGRLPEFWALLGVPAPAPGATIVIRDEPVTGDASSADGDVRIVGEPGAGEVAVSASSLLALGSPLLQGIDPNNILVVGSATDEAAGFVAGESIVSAIPVANIRSGVTEISHDLWIASGLLTAAAMAAAWIITGRALRPVEAITRRVDEIAAAGRGERVPEPVDHDEIGHLARTVNTMLERLDRAALAQRRFVADASHELRSPLAVLRTEAEVALAHPEAADWPATTRSMLDETTRLEGLVTDLLLLARHDEGRASSRDAVTDVDEVALAEAARARRVPVDARAVLAGRIAGQPGEVRRVIQHLLDNAARHAREHVAIAVRTEGADVVVIVDDDGAGIPDADRPRVFERFARLEEARGRDEGGAGLGLSVVAAVVRDLGGTIEVTTAPHGGARFCVRLPAV